MESILKYIIIKKTVMNEWSLPSVSRVWAPPAVDLSCSLEWKSELVHRWREDSCSLKSSRTQASGFSKTAASGMTTVTSLCMASREWRNYPESDNKGLHKCQISLCCRVTWPNSPDPYRTHQGQGMTSKHVTSTHSHLRYFTFFSSSLQIRKLRTFLAIKNL